VPGSAFARTNVGCATRRGNFKPTSDTRLLGPGGRAYMKCYYSGVAYIGVNLFKKLEAANVAYRACP
jgi:hypothetical protein